MDDQWQAATVKALVPERGYGFASRAGKLDVLLHVSDIGATLFDALQVGQPIEITVRDTPKGARATQARVT